MRETDGEELYQRFRERRDDVVEVVDRQGVVVAYVFGSASSGDIGPLSDIDMAVLLDGAEYRDLLNDLIGVLGDRIDLVDLETASVTMQFNAIQGNVLYERSEAERVQFESLVMRRFMDQRYYRERYNERMKEQIREEGLV